MANLKRRHTFKRWAPDIGENRDLPEPALWFEIATGLSVEQISAVKERMAQPIPEPPEGLEGKEWLAFIVAAIRVRYLEAFGQYVRIVGGPHTIDGARLETLEDYLVIVEQQADKGKTAVTDLFSALLAFNSFTGHDELFLQRRSGLSASTGPQSAAKEEPKTDVP